MKKFARVAVLAMTALGIGWGVLGTSAHISANQLTFSVQPELPDNQVNQDEGFFDIQLGQGQSQDLVLDYTNPSNKEITVTTKVAPATTNVKGVVEYGESKAKLDSTLKYNMKDFVQVPDKITLAPKTTQKVKVHVSMPDGQVNGMIAGGLTFSDEAADKANQKASGTKGMAISNVYAFQLGLIMRQNKTATYTDANIQADGLKLQTVQPGQLNYRNVINANLQNPLDVYVNQMVVKARISKAGSTAATYQVTQGDMQMAPNSNFDFPIALGDGQKMAPGKYTLDLTTYATKDETGQYKLALDNKDSSYKYRWHFKKDFTITAEKATQYNAKDVTIHETNWWLGLAIIGLLLAAGLIWFLLFRRKQKQVRVEEEVTDRTGEKVWVVRTMTQRQFERLVKQGVNVRRLYQEED